MLVSRVTDPAEHLDRSSRSILSGYVCDRLLELEDDPVGHEHTCVGVLGDQIHSLTGISGGHGRDHVIGCLGLQGDICSGNRDQDRSQDDYLGVFDRELG